MKKAVVGLLLMSIWMTSLFGALADQGNSSTALDAFNALAANTRQRNPSFR